MIFVIRCLLFVARPRRSGPFLRSRSYRRQGKTCRRRLKRLKSGEKERSALSARGVGYTAGGASRRLVRAGRLKRRTRCARVARAWDWDASPLEKSVGQGGVDQPDRGRLDRGAGCASSAGFGYGT